MFDVVSKERNPFDVVSRNKRSLDAAMPTEKCLFHVETVDKSSFDLKNGSGVREEVPFDVNNWKREELCSRVVQVRLFLLYFSSWYFTIPAGT